MDITTITDPALEDLRIQILTEQEHRARLAVIPGRVAEMAAAWREAGRDTAELVEALTDGTTT